MKFLLQRRGNHKRTSSDGDDDEHDVENYRSYAGHLLDKPSSPCTQPHPDPMCDRSRSSGSRATLGTARTADTTQSSSSFWSSSSYYGSSAAASGRTVTTFDPFGDDESMSAMMMAAGDNNGNTPRQSTEERKRNKASSSSSAPASKLRSDYIVIPRGAEATAGGSGAGGGGRPSSRNSTLVDDAQSTAKSLVSSIQSSITKLDEASAERKQRGQPRHGRNDRDKKDDDAAAAAATMATSGNSDATFGEILGILKEVNNDTTIDCHADATNDAQKKKGKEAVPSDAVASASSPAAAAAVMYEMSTAHEPPSHRPTSSKRHRRRLSIGKNRKSGAAADNDDVGGPVDLDESVPSSSSASSSLNDESSSTDIVDLVVSKLALSDDALMMMSKEEGAATGSLRLTTEGLERHDTKMRILSDLKGAEEEGMPPPRRGRSGRSSSLRGGGRCNSAGVGSGCGRGVAGGMENYVEWKRRTDLEKKEAKKKEQHLASAGEKEKGVDRAQTVVSEGQRSQPSHRPRRHRRHRTSDAAEDMDLLLKGSGGGSNDLPASSVIEGGSSGGGGSSTARHHNPLATKAFLKKAIGAVVHKNKGDDTNENATPSSSAPGTPSPRRGHHRRVSSNNPAAVLLHSVSSAATKQQKMSKTAKHATESILIDDKQKDRELFMERRRKRLEEKARVVHGAQGPLMTTTGEGGASPSRAHRRRNKSSGSGKLSCSGTTPARSTAHVMGSSSLTLQQSESAGEDGMEIIASPIGAYGEHRVDLDDDAVSSLAMGSVVTSMDPPSSFQTRPPRRWRSGGVMGAGGRGGHNNHAPSVSSDCDRTAEVDNRRAVRLKGIDEKAVAERWVSHQSLDDNSPPSGMGPNIHATGGNDLQPHCVVCSSRNRTHLAVPCMHFAFCHECVLVLHERGVKRCPVCDEDNVTFSRVNWG